MAQRISKAQKRKMHNVFIQFFKFIALNFRIMKVVTTRHGGTRQTTH